MVQRPSRYPMKLWGLFGMVAKQHRAKFCDWSIHQNGHFSLVKMYFVISQPISTFQSMILQPHILLTHKYTASISHFLYESIGIHYQRYSTTGKTSFKTRCTFSVGVMRYLNQFQLSLHKIIITTTSLYILLMPHLIF